MTEKDINLSPSQVAAELGLTPHNARKLIMEGLDPVFQSGKFKFYRREDVQLKVREQFSEILEFLGLSEVFVDGSGHPYISSLAEEIEEQRFMDTEV